MTNEELVERIQNGIDPGNNIKQLYIQNEKFISLMIKKYSYIYKSNHDSTPIIEKAELMNEAYFGIVKAAELFDPQQGVKFLTYAAYLINQVIKRFLENSGRIIRVPVHTQQKVYKYNQISRYYLRNYGREPSKQEYASLMNVSVKELYKLEKFMFQETVHSLDEILPGNDNESLSLGDTVSSEDDVEQDVIEKVAAEQIKEELWNIVNQVLKDDKKVQALKWRYVDGLSYDEIADKIKVNRTDIEQLIKQSMKRLRCNTRTRKLGEELGLYSREFPIDAIRVKQWASDGMVRFLSNRELKYAANMGWIVL